MSIKTSNNRFSNPLKDANHALELSDALPEFLEEQEKIEDDMNNLFLAAPSSSLSLSPATDDYAPRSKAEKSTRSSTETNSKNNSKNVAVNTSTNVNKASRTLRNTPVKNEEVEDEYAIDPETGVRYKKLFSLDPDYTKEFSRSKGKTIMPWKAVPDVEDFDVNDLNSAADLFMGHMRVAPSKEEIEELRRRYTEQQRQKDKAYSELAEELSKDDPTEEDLEEELNKATSKVERKILRKKK